MSRLEPARQTLQPQTVAGQILWMFALPATLDLVRFGVAANRALAAARSLLRNWPSEFQKLRPLASSTALYFGTLELYLVLSLLNFLAASGKDHCGICTPAAGHLKAPFGGGVLRRLFPPTSACGRRLGGCLGGCGGAPWLASSSSLHCWSLKPTGRSGRLSGLTCLWGDLAVADAEARPLPRTCVP